jgi:hypothetical protein
MMRLPTSVEVENWVKALVEHASERGIVVLSQHHVCDSVRHVFQSTIEEYWLRVYTDRSSFRELWSFWPHHVPLLPTEVGMHIRSFLESPEIPWRFLLLNIGLSDEGAKNKVCLAFRGNSWSGYPADSLGFISSWVWPTIDHRIERSLRMLIREVDLGRGKLGNFTYSDPLVFDQVYGDCTGRPLGHIHSPILMLQMVPGDGGANVGYKPLESYWCKHRKSIFKDELLYLRNVLVEIPEKAREAIDMSPSYRVAYIARQTMFGIIIPVLDLFLNVIGLSIYATEKGIMPTILIILDSRAFRTLCVGIVAFFCLMYLRFFL